MTDGYVDYKVFDSKDEVSEDAERQQKKGHRTAGLVHIRRVLECGDVELSNNLSEQMMRRIKMNLKNACNIGSEISAKHNAFMFSVIES